MVFKDGTSIDLDTPLGPAPFWNYFDTSGFEKGYLGAAENAAGFNRGRAEPVKK